MDVDVREELEDYLHLFRRSTDKGTHLNSCSPFRSDEHPSFYVYFEDTDSAKAGFWGDHAADVDEFSRGTFLKLLAFVRNESEDTTFEYLNQKYGTDAPADMSRLRIKGNRKMGRMFRRNDEYDKRKSKTDEYAETHLQSVTDAYRYLSGRGISAEVAAMFNVGCRDGALSIPWKDARGEIITVKYRSLDSKKFWYMADGADITGELFGIHHVYNSHDSRIYIVESEIDVMYLYTLGYTAVALGNKAMNEARAELLRKAPFTELVIIPDNDEAGRYAAESILKFMSSYKPVYIAEIPDGYKDINDLRPEAAKAVADAAEQIKPLTSKIYFKEINENA